MSANVCASTGKELCLLIHKRGKGTIFMILLRSQLLLLLLLLLLLRRQVRRERVCHGSGSRGCCMSGQPGMNREPWHGGRRQG